MFRRCAKSSISSRRLPTLSRMLPLQQRHHQAPLTFGTVLQQQQRQCSTSSNGGTSSTTDSSQYVSMDHRDPTKKSYLVANPEVKEELIRFTIQMLCEQVLELHRRQYQFKLFDEEELAALDDEFQYMMLVKAQCASYLNYCFKAYLDVNSKDDEVIKAFDVLCKDHSPVCVVHVVVQFAQILCTLSTPRCPEKDVYDEHKLEAHFDAFRKHLEELAKETLGMSDPMNHVCPSQTRADLVAELALQGKKEARDIFVFVSEDDEKPPPPPQ